MKRVGIDTNVVVSFLTTRDPEQQDRAAALFGAAASGERVIIVHQAVITEAVYVMCNVYAGKPKVVSAAMRDLLRLPGVMTVDAIEWPAVWRSWPSRIREFGDACLAAVGKADGFDELATFDAKLAKRARRLGLATYW